MLLTHLIQHKGKGALVLIAPLITGFFFALIFEGLNLEGKYLPPSAILLAAVIVWLIDNKTRAKTTIGHREVKNSLMWIDMKYWSFALGALGMALFLGVIFNYIT